MKNIILSLDEFIYESELYESGLRNIKELAKQYKEADLYFHMDLDGVTSAIGMKEYLAQYGIKVVRCQHIQYGGREFAADKPKPGRLAVMVDFAHGKPMMHIHTDHHDSQTGVELGTSAKFKHDPSNVSTISQEISPRDIFPNEDIKIISMIDSADFANNDISVDQILKAAYSFDKSINIEKNRTYMGLVANKILLAFKNKPNFLEDVVMKAKASLISIFTVARKIAVDNKYPLAELQSSTDAYIDSQSRDKKMVEISSPKEIMNLKGGEYVMLGTCIIQYGGGSMMKGGYDRYTPFKNNPEAEYLVIGWPTGLVQAAKNPFKKGKNQFNLGDIAKDILGKYKSKLSKEMITFGDLKRQMETDIYKKGSKDSFGFTGKDLEALFGDAVKGLKNDSFKEMINDISDRHYNKLSPKQKEMLDKVSVSLYDVIIKSSGGHKDITNISGLNFMGKDYTTFLKQIMVDFAEILKDAKLV